MFLEEIHPALLSQHRTPGKQDGAVMWGSQLTVESIVDSSTASTDVRNCWLMAVVGDCGQDWSGQVVSTSGFWSSTVHVVES